MGLMEKKPAYDKPNRIFEGIETRDDYTNWNVSLEPYTKFQQLEKIYCQ